MRLAAPGPATLTFSCPDGFRVRTAPRLQEVYVEARGSSPGSARLDEIYAEPFTTLIARARVDQVYLEVWYKTKVALLRPLRLTQRDDGLGTYQHARIQAGSLPNAATSTQWGQTPRIGTNNRYS